MRHFKFLLTVLFVFSFWPVALVAQTEADLSKSRKLARIKAAYIYKFTNYAYWPLEDLMKEFRICVMSSENLSQQIEEVVSRVKFRNRIPIRVIFCKTPADIKDCHMLVLDAADKSQNLWAAYSKIRGKKVLMVTENLVDYQKSMISFMMVGEKLKYITNKTKLEESQLVIKEELYTLGIVKEGEWRSIFDKFKYLLDANTDEVKVDRSDIAEIVSQYQSMANDQKLQQVTISQMEDSLQSKMAALKVKMDEYEKLNARIDTQKVVLRNQEAKMKTQETLIKTRETEIGKQQTVITIIAALTGLILLLLLLAIRVNGQRRKANKLLQLQKNEIERQKQLVEEKQKEILDSINYAKRIQTALMASESMLNNHLPEHFVMFKPKDIVAGDFYWASVLPDSVVYITADSTGHGVPGAFMSLLNISKLNEAVNQKHINRPDLVLNHVKKEIIEALNPEGSTEESKDGMDATLCKLDLKNMRLQYAAANNSFCIVRGEEVLTCQADKMPVGKSHDDSQPFSFNELQLQKGDMIYTYTDGYIDQFGGPQGKKMKYKLLRDALVRAAKLPVAEQKEMLSAYFESWKGGLEQVDDVLLIGVRV